MKYLISLSGGKDSTACLLWALNTLQKEDIIPYYIDTKWEHDSVYEYLDYLEDKLDIKIIRLESEGMEALCKRKKVMPNPVMRFCTYELKIKTFLIYQYDNFISKGIDYINIVGVRREESASRANSECFVILKETVRFDDGRDNVTIKIKVMRPVAYWTTQRVFDYHKENGIDVNPLYKKGFKRVGCYPCIYANKHELILIENKYIQRLRNLENDMKEIGGKECTFFNKDKDKHLRKTFDFGEDYSNQCVNQFGICE